MGRSSEQLLTLIRNLAAAPRESEWVEFKVNNSDPDEIGEYVSALANSAALQGKPQAYLVWGVSDDDHELVGTSFRPRSEKVRIFSDRMEITNPGRSLIDPLRFIDEPPRSRNEALASLMRRASICEERGSGIDKVISMVEDVQLPAPDFRVTGGSTVAVLFGPREFAQMDRGDRIRASYQHACFMYVSGKRMTNATLRKRLGIKDTNYPMASRIIRDAVGAELVKPYARGSESKKDASYVPFWA